MRCSGGLVSDWLLRARVAVQRSKSYTKSYPLFPQFSSGLILYVGVLWASDIRCGTSVLRVSISLPPPWQPNVYMAKIPRSETSPGQAKSFLMISWHCGRVVSGSHPPLLRTSLCPLSSGLGIAMVRPRSVNSALGSPESPGSGAGFQPGLLLVP